MKKKSPPLGESVGVADGTQLTPLLHEKLWLVKERQNLGAHIFEPRWGRPRTPAEAPTPGRKRRSASHPSTTSSRHHAPELRALCR